MKREKQKKARSMTDTELEKRLTLEANSVPGSIQTSLSRIGGPIGPTGEHLTEPEKRSDS